MSKGVKIMLKNEKEAQEIKFYQERICKMVEKLNNLRYLKSIYRITMNLLI